MTDTKYCHVRIADSGEAVIGLEQLPVSRIVVDFRKNGLSPEQIAEEYGVRLSAVYSALAYYHYHAESVEREIERRTALARDLRSELESPSASEQLRAAKIEKLKRA